MYAHILMVRPLRIRLTGNGPKSVITMDHVNLVAEFRQFIRQVVGVNRITTEMVRWVKCSYHAELH